MEIVTVSMQIKATMAFIALPIRQIVWSLVPALMHARTVQSLRVPATYY
jgi:hypothetical protein